MDCPQHDHTLTWTYVCAHAAGHTAAHASDASTPAAAAGSTAVDADDSFWSGQDEWADVRSALMGIGINASLDEEDDEDVWALEAGRVKTRRWGMVQMTKGCVLLSIGSDYNELKHPLLVFCFAGLCLVSVSFMAPQLCNQLGTSHAICAVAGLQHRTMRKLDSSFPCCRQPTVPGCSCCSCYSNPLAARLCRLDNQYFPITCLCDVFVCQLCDLHSPCCHVGCPCCRTRLLRSLPKLDSSTAQQLTAFLAEVQQHMPAGRHSSNSTMRAASTASTAAGHGNQSAGTVSEEEEQWWQQATLAYSLLRQQAGRVQQEQEHEQEEVVMKQQ